VATLALKPICSGAVNSHSKLRGIVEDLFALDFFLVCLAYMMKEEVSLFEFLDAENAKAA
jgi:hypothetical protein